MIESVDRSDNVFGSDKELSEEFSIGSSPRLGLPWGNILFIQCGNLCDEAWWTKGFSRI